MYTCRICRFETEADDVLCPTQSGWCICLSCFNRNTGSFKEMPKALRQDIQVTLAGVK